MFKLEVTISLKILTIETSDGRVVMLFVLSIRS